MYFLLRFRNSATRLISLGVRLAITKENMLRTYFKGRALTSIAGYFGFMAYNLFSWIE